MSLSVCVICFNEEQNIRRCLESASWADEIVVVDSMSEDKTVEIAKEYTDSVFQRPWTGYENQKNFALSKARGDWIFSVDADEEVTEALRNEIKAEIRKTNAKDGYRIPRRSFYQGRWINHSGFYPDRQLRLFKCERGRWTGGRVHERVEINGSIGDLENDLLHYPYKGIISGQLQTVNNFSTLMAEDMQEKGKRYHVSLLLLRPLFKFVEVYLLKRGFLDGLAGFIIATSSAYAMFIRYVKLREIENHLGQ
ncbi:MAG: glycosyltransferase family 2 protein [Deltaproteobacteria bacterium]|nr:glycosyltransferase family 2 protein [Deltaproteobacteria bacterium]